MTSSSPLTPSSAQKPGILRWMHVITPHRAGIMVLVLALLYTIASYILQATLNYPAILIDRATLANSLVTKGAVAALLGFIALLLCGLLLIVVSLGLESYLEEQRRTGVIITGSVAGMSWTVSGLLGLVLVPLWIGFNTTAAQVLATVLLALAEIGAPLVLAFWTVSLARQFRTHRVLGWLGALGLLLVLLRSLIWVLNALLPIEAGFYGTAGLLAVLAVVGESLWLVWLFLFSFHLMRWSNKTPVAAPVEHTDLLQEGEANA